MPEYEIEDTETGLKIPVVGDSAPTQEEAEALIMKEFNDIKTNLFELPDGKFFLDVGPLYDNREFYDKGRNAFGRAKQIGDAFESGKKFANETLAEYDKKNEKKPDWVKTRPDWKSLYDEQQKRFYETNRLEKVGSVAEQTMAHLPPGTLLIDAHGSNRNKNLSSEWGHEFTMHNLAKLLGDKVGGISNVVNTACYGASCEPVDYESAFPKLSTIRHADTNFSNVISVNNMMSNRLFSVPEVSWRKDPAAGWVKSAPKETEK